MLNILALLLASLAIASTAGIPAKNVIGLLPQLDGHIVDGETTSITQFPYQVSVQRSGMHACGGAVFSKTVIITVAHCLQFVSASVLQVRAGSSRWNGEGALFAVASFYNHDDYNPNSMENDIAMIKLNSSLSYSSTIRPIYVSVTTPVSGTAAVVTGWGTEQFGYPVLAEQLRKIDVKIIDAKDCSSEAYGYGRKVKSTMICAAARGKDTCQGDSGGPLVSDGYLIGLVSWGYGCALSDFPGVYTDVAAFSNWILASPISIKFSETA